MATFASFNNRLPDPTFGVTDAGSLGGPNVGPGFATADVQSTSSVQVSRTLSGRGVQRDNGSHFWSIAITYHPMRRDQFDVVNTFLDGRNGRLNPFFVVLPQNAAPKDAIFAAYCQSNIINVVADTAAGSPTIMMQAPGALTNYARPGDMFTITDPNDVNHLKAYKVSFVETNQLYQQGTTQPGVNQMLIHTIPPLTRFAANGSVINWIDPEFRVYQKNDVVEYQLSTDNLYQFQLDLEEIMP